MLTRRPSPPQSEERGGACAACVRLSGDLPGHGVEVEAPKVLEQNVGTWAGDPGKGVSVEKVCVWGGGGREHASAC